MVAKKPINATPSAEATFFNVRGHSNKIRESKKETPKKKRSQPSIFSFGEEKQMSSSSRKDSPVVSRVKRRPNTSINPPASPPAIVGHSLTLRKGARTFMLANPSELTC